MARKLALLLVLALLAGPSVALGQNEPFAPLPPAPQATPEPTAAPRPSGQQPVSREFLLGIAGTVLLIFVGIGVYISRDARRNLTPEDRRALERSERAEAQGPGPRSPAAKRRARAKAKAQRRARRVQRRR